MRNRKAVIAPTSPPIYEITAEIFWTYLWYDKELVDLAKYILAKWEFALSEIPYGWFRALFYAITPEIVYELV